MTEIYIDLREFSAVPNFQRFNRYNKVFIGHRSLLSSNIHENFDKFSCLYDELEQSATKSVAEYKSIWLSECSKPLEEKISSQISNNGLSPLLVNHFTSSFYKHLEVASMR